MPTQEITLSDQELQVVKEVQQALGLETIEETIEFLARQRESNTGVIQPCSAKTR